jgi:hypothetical protein
MQKYKYEIVDNGIHKVILRTSETGEVSSVPMVEGNSDYQAYLAEQSTPMVTDEAATL